MRDGWTEEELRWAAAFSATTAEVVRKLGLRVTSWTHQHIAARMREFGIQPGIESSQRRGGGRRRSWTDEQLIEAAETSHTLSEILEKLGLSRGGATLTAVRTRMVALGLEPAHGKPHKAHADWNASPQTLRSSTPAGQRTWSDGDLARAVAVSKSLAAVLRELNLKVGGGTYLTLKRRIAQLGLDTSHFTGKGWAKGAKNPAARPARPLEQILVRNSDYLKTSELRRRLINEGLREARCAICGGTQWNELPMPLQLDHINGNRTDNRLDNLRILCPNCHSQTDTWCGRNHGRYDDPDTVAESPGSGGGTAYTRLSNRRALQGLRVRIPPGAPFRCCRGPVYRVGISASALLA